MIFIVVSLAGSGAVAGVQTAADLALDLHCRLLVQGWTECAEAQVNRCAGSGAVAQHAAADLALDLHVALLRCELRDELAAPDYGQERLMMPAWILVLIFMVRLSGTLADRQDAGLDLGLDLHWMMPSSSE